MFPKLQVLNINNNPILDIGSLIDLLGRACPSLLSLFMNLSREDEVDYVLKWLPQLEYLNGLGVDREELEMIARVTNPEEAIQTNHQAVNSS